MTIVMLGIPNQLAEEISQGQPFHTPSLGELKQEIDDQFVGAAIFCPLFGTFDVLSLIEVLNASKFHGRLTIILPQLPNATMVAAELRSSASGAYGVEVISP